MVEFINNNFSLKCDGLILSQNRKMEYAIICLIILSSICSTAQSIKVQPYLQDATPSSIHILWETDSIDESIVIWGLTESLGDTSYGTARLSNGQSSIHEVKLEGLTRFTKYYYQIKTSNITSEIFNFKTPPFSADHESFRILAMSDMQQDGAFPNKYHEIVHDGVLNYLDQNIGGDIVDNLGLILIPGDLVQNGNNYASWQKTFFEPSQDLLSSIPVYPVLGNHEVNSKYYFQYFKLPNNGTNGFEEHWWYKDYGNVRIIGLNSNNPFNNQIQLEWLDTILEASCTTDSIDFVFAQLHHPHKSELWTPGESNYTGEVITRLDKFTELCQKPTIHFFGHTHGYSRGNSRDHKHLWLNVATAGGAIDNWGEFPNFDYNEFSVSQDDYGFVLVEVTDDQDPKIVVKRISRGDQDTIINNKLTDSVVIRLMSNDIDPPVAIYPVNQKLRPECIILKASKFISTDQTAQHGQSHWQVSEDEISFDNPIVDSWKSFENWYYEKNTQNGDDLTDDKILGLEENTEYWWRVRYRDRELNWSNWSIPVSFSTDNSKKNPNLLLNAGAEDDLDAWTTVEGVVEALISNECSGIAAHSGNKYFGVGGICEHSELGRCFQNIDVKEYADSIDKGDFLVSYGGFLSNFGGKDLPEMKLIFMDKDQSVLGESKKISSLTPTWTMIEMIDTIPINTRIIQLELMGTRKAGTDNDSYFDDLFVRLGNVEPCERTTNSKNHPINIKHNLKFTPNPTSNSASIVLPNGIEEMSAYSLFVIDALGSKQRCPISYEGNKIIIESGSLKNGLYYIILRKNGELIGTGRLIFQN